MPNNDIFTALLESKKSRNIQHKVESSTSTADITKLSDMILESFLAYYKNLDYTEKDMQENEDTFYTNSTKLRTNLAYDTIKKLNGMPDEVKVFEDDYGDLAMEVYKEGKLVGSWINITEDRKSVV